MPTATGFIMFLRIEFISCYLVRLSHSVTNSGIYSCLQEPRNGIRNADECLRLRLRMPMDAYRHPLQLQLFCYALAPVYRLGLQPLFFIESINPFSIYLRHSFLSYSISLIKVSKLSTKLFYKSKPFYLFSLYIDKR